MAGIALVTGGGGAIALEIALRLSERGYRLVLVDLDEARLATNAAILPAGTDCLKVDLADADELEALATRVETGSLPVDLLVNNAGYMRPGRIIAIDAPAMIRHIAINLVAPMRLVQAASKSMSARGEGKILSIVSAAALVALPGGAAYSASKAGLRAFLAATHLELAARGVVLAGIFPGAVDTPMLRHEATHGGSALNFMNKDVLTAAAVANAALSALEKGRLETFLPWSDGVLSKIVANAPGLLERLLPYFEKKGEIGRARFIASRGL